MQKSFWSKTLPYPHEAKHGICAGRGQRPVQTTPPRAIPQIHTTPLIPSPKAAQSNGNNPESGNKAVPPRDVKQRRQGRHSDDTEGDSTDPDHVENHWQYAALPSIFPKRA